MSPRILMAAYAALALLAPTTGHSQSLRDEIEGVVKDYILQHPQDIQQIIKDYLVSHPEVVQQVLVEALRNRPPGAASPAGAAVAPAAADKSALVKGNAAALFGSKRWSSSSIMRAASASGRYRIRSSCSRAIRN
jgi:hypothetical protein